jgi:hypothetical protein
MSKDAVSSKKQLLDRLAENWMAWGAPTDRETCINETCMAMDCNEARLALIAQEEQIERLRDSAADTNALVAQQSAMIERLRAALVMMKHAYEKDQRPNMFIVDEALEAAPPAETSGELCQEGAIDCPPYPHKKGPL